MRPSSATDSTSIPDRSRNAPFACADCRPFVFGRMPRRRPTAANGEAINPASGRDYLPGSRRSNQPWHTTRSREGAGRGSCCRSRKSKTRMRIQSRIHVCCSFMLSQKRLIDIISKIIVLTYHKITSSFVGSNIL